MNAVSRRAWLVLVLAAAALHGCRKDEPAAQKSAAPPAQQAPEATGSAPASAVESMPPGGAPTKMEGASKAMKDVGDRPAPTTVCVPYCAKLKQCGVKATDTCERDCRTVLTAGVDQKAYHCVVARPCAQVSNCGI